MKKPAKGAWRNRIKYILCSVWLLAVLGAAVHAGGFRRIDPLFGIARGTVLQDYLLRFGAYVLIVPLALLFGRWASCRYLCWIAPF